MSSENKEELVANFTGVTGVDADRAKFYLEASGWKLEVAMGAFYQDDDDGDAGDAPVASDPSPPPREDAPQPRQQSRFATIASMQQGGSDSDSSDEERQPFYAGGSERSGQQVLGPPRKKKDKQELVKEMFDSAKEHGAEVVEPGSSGSGRRPGQTRFVGTGYRLGDQENAPTDVVMGAPVRQAPREIDIVLKFWKNGFSIDDGPLRDFKDPANAQFLQSIKNGEVPSELTRMARGGEVNLNMEDHSTEEYVRPKVPVRAFGGEGQRLGSAIPAVTVAAPAENKSNESAAKSSVTVDDSQPTTNVQIRLGDGSRLVAKFNHSHTVADIRLYIEAARPQMVGANYVLMTTFPNKELTEASQTLADGKLLNSSIVQRMK